MIDQPIQILRANTTQDFATARALFIEYAAGLDIDLAFQGFQQEIDTLPDHYGQWDTCILIAGEAQNISGCIGVRRFDAQTCEMKRLYVREHAQGTGVGRLLAREAIAFAMRCGYKSMILDSLPTMVRAIKLYRSLGFKQVPAYYSSPVKGTLYMELRLDSPQNGTDHKNN